MGEPGLHGPCGPLPGHSLQVRLCAWKLKVSRNSRNTFNSFPPGWGACHSTESRCCSQEEPFLSQPLDGGSLSLSLAFSQGRRGQKYSSQAGHRLHGRCCTAFRGHTHTCARSRGSCGPETQRLNALFPSGLLLGRSPQPQTWRPSPSPDEVALLPSAVSRGDGAHLLQHKREGMAIHSPGGNSGEIFTVLLCVCFALLRCN